MQYGAPVFYISSPKIEQPKVYEAVVGRISNIYHSLRKF
jgi:hypothetical protein